MCYIGSNSLHELFARILKVRLVVDRVVSYRTYTSFGMNLLSQLWMCVIWYHMVDQIRVLDRILVPRRQKVNHFVQLKKNLL
jgi:hypothetical protein